MAGYSPRTTGSHTFVPAPCRKARIVLGSQLRVNSRAANTEAVDTASPGSTTRYQGWSRSTGSRRSPTPLAQAARPRTKTGTSAPRPSPISASSSIDRPIAASASTPSRRPHSRSSPSSTAAASELPPPRPPPTGIRLSTRISTPGTAATRSASTRAARSTRSSAAGTGFSPWRAITGSSRRRKTSVSASSMNWKTVSSR